MRVLKHTLCKFRFLQNRLLQNNNIRCLKQFYDSLNDENEYALKWKIHDTLSRLGSLEDTFTQVYVYDLKEIHHYDHHNTFWDRTMLLQNNNIRRLKQFYDSLNDEYQKSYSGTRRSLGSWTVLPSFFFSFLRVLKHTISLVFL